MAIETGNYISDLDTSNPPGSDNLSTIDDHARLIKTFIKQTFPNLNGEVSATPGDLNRVVLMRSVQGDVSATSGDLNRLTLMRGIQTEVSATSGDLNRLIFMRSISREISATSGALNRVAGITSFGKTLIDSSGDFTASAVTVVSITTNTLRVFLDSQMDGDLDVSGITATRLELSANLTVDGNSFFGKTGSGLTATGCYALNTGVMAATSYQQAAIYAHRLGDDGALINLMQDGTVEGSISVSGTTISYNSFCGSHWTQGVPVDTPVGTLLSTLPDLCQWTGKRNDQLTKCRITEETRDPAIAGVFMGADPDTGQIYQAGLGFFLARVNCKNGPIKVGDLLCSSKVPGVAMRQGDDVIHNYTLGKSRGIYNGDGEATIPVTLFSG